MTKSELSQNNYKRISLINWLLTVPLIVLFAWPYLYVGNFARIEATLCSIGAFLFSVPFTLTILHGHVTMALGSVHRHHYYHWLEENSLTYGLLFHPIFTRTRFRLVLLMVSIIIFLIGWLIQSIG